MTNRFFTSETVFTISDIVKKSISSRLGTQCNPTKIEVVAYFPHDTDHEDIAFADKAINTAMAQLADEYQKSIVTTLCNGIGYLKNKKPEVVQAKINKGFILALIVSEQEVKKISYALY
jgi:hypothetical protein